ncbi:MAG: AI-2E family transporter [Burkholderiales bacterium]|nr:AI-2E family transporter [Burkholderiales bacterium]
MLASGVVIAFVVGYTLHIAKDVLVPIVLGILAMYVVVGMLRVLERASLAGHRLPVSIRYTLTLVGIGAAFVALGYFIMATADRALALAPNYQKSLLEALQRTAAMLNIEREPTWATLRDALLAQVNMQRLATAALASVTGMLGSFSVVFLYVAFLMLERRGFSAKIAAMSDDPHAVARIRGVIENINARIGSYLALKTLLSVILALVSWAVMRLMGLELAGFWAVITGLLNFIPYLGTVISIVLPVLMALVQFGDFGSALALLAALAVVQFVIGNFIDPYVMGNSLNLSPVAILASLTVWSGLWGIAGAFLAVPVTAIMVIVLSEFAGTRPVAVLLSRTGEV